MKTPLILVAIAIAAIAVVLSLSSCETPVCPGYERIDQTPGCRNVTTGEFAAPEHCEEC